jgi:CBS domain-containing protein
MEISQVMHSPAIVVTPETPLADAVASMVNHDITELPVISETGELIGIVGEADLYRARLTEEHAPSGRPTAVQPYGGHVVGDLMRRPVISIRANESFGLCQLRLTGLARTLPVLDGRNVVGVISRRDLLKVFAREETESSGAATIPSWAPGTNVEQHEAPSPSAESSSVSLSVPGSESAPVPTHVTVAMVMSRPVISIEPHQSLSDAWALVTSNGVRHLAVTDGQHCVGLIDDRQLADVWPQGPAAMKATAVGHLMGRRVAGVLPGASISEAAVIMKGDGVDAVPVIDEHGVLLGLVTSADIVGAVARWGIDTESVVDPTPRRELDAPQPDRGSVVQDGSSAEPSVI